MPSVMPRIKIEPDHAAQFEDRFRTRARRVDGPSDIEIHDVLLIHNEQESGHRGDPAS